MAPQPRNQYEYHGASYSGNDSFKPVASKDHRKSHGACAANQLPSQAFWSCLLAQALQLIVHLLNCHAPIRKGSTYGVDLGDGGQFVIGLANTTHPSVDASVRGMQRNKQACWSSKPLHLHKSCSQAHSFDRFLNSIHLGPTSEEQFSC